MLGKFNVHKMCTGVINSGRNKMKLEY